MLNKRYPDLIVEGGLYPPSTYNSILAKVLNIGKMLVISAILFDMDISRYLGRMASSWYWCRTNKIYSCALIFFICNFIEGNLISTGNNIKTDFDYIINSSVIDMVLIGFEY